MFSWFKKSKVKHGLLAARLPPIIEYINQLSESDKKKFHFQLAILSQKLIDDYLLKYGFIDDQNVSFLELGKHLSEAQFDECLSAIDSWTAELQKERLVLMAMASIVTYIAVAGNHPQTNSSPPDVAAGMVAAEMCDDIRHRYGAEAEKDIEQHRANSPNID